MPARAAAVRRPSRAAASGPRSSSRNNRLGLGLVFVLRFRYRNSGAAFLWCSAHRSTDPCVRIARRLVFSARHQTEKSAKESLDSFQHHLPLQIRTRGSDELRPYSTETRGLAPARTAPAAQHLDSAPLIALLLEWIAVHLVAHLFPVARSVAVDELQAPQPLGALPRVEVRNH